MVPSLVILSNDAQFGTLANRTENLKLGDNFC